jgi:ABC-type multidrug transport system permease subunit
MSITGFVIGWRIRGSLVETVLAYVLMMAFAFAMIWIGVLLGSIVRTPEGVTGLAFAVLFPLTFVASTFVPLESMPDALEGFAAWNPVTTLSDALRELFGNPNTPTKPSDPWPVQHPVAYTWIWVIGIIAVCAPLAVRAFQRTNAD